MSGNIFDRSRTGVRWSSGFVGVVDVAVAVEDAGWDWG